MSPNTKNTEGMVDITEEVLNYIFGGRRVPRAGVHVVECGDDGEPLKEAEVLAVRHDDHKSI